MDKVKTRQQGLPFGISEISLLLVALFVVATTSVANAEEPVDERLSLTSKGNGDARDTRKFDVVTTDSYQALRDSEPAKGQDKTLAKVTEPATQQESAYGDYWVFSVDVDLFQR